MKIPYRLVASDLDGTLLGPGQTVSGRTRRALRLVQEQGAIVVLATARPPLTTRVIAERLGVDGYAVCSNGAILYDIARDEIAGHHPLDPDAARRLILALRESVADVCFAFVQERSFSCEAAYAAIARVEDHGRLIEEMSIADALDHLAAPVTKLIVRHPERAPAEMHALVQQLGLAGFEASHSGAPFLEIVAENVTKARGLANLCATLRIAPAEAIAFGDAPNDIAMLRWAGRGVAVANAFPAALAAADEITLTNEEDGVAATLERLFS